MIDQVVLIVGEIKNKLIMKAIDKYDLLSNQMKSDTEGAPQGPIGDTSEPAPLPSAGENSPEAAVESLTAPEPPTSAIE